MRILETEPWLSPWRQQSVARTFIRAAARGATERATRARASGKDGHERASIYRRGACLRISTRLTRTSPSSSFSRLISSGCVLRQDTILHSPRRCAPVLILVIDVDPRSLSRQHSPRRFSTPSCPLCTSRAQPISSAAHTRPHRLLSYRYATPLKNLNWPCCEFKYGAFGEPLVELQK